MRSGGAWWRSNRASGYSLVDGKAIGRFMPPVFPGVTADTLPELARKLGLPVDTFLPTPIPTTRPAASARSITPCSTIAHTEASGPPEAHWARPIDTGQFYGYALKPGVTFTYLGLHTDTTRRPCALTTSRATSSSSPAK